MKLARAALTAALVLGAADARAQRVTSSIDAGGTSMRYADTLSTTAAVVSPAFNASWSRATLGGAASIAHLSSGGLSSQGALAGSVFTPSAGPFAGEFAGALGGSVHQDGSHTGEYQGTARLHLMGSAGGIWGGAGAGQMWDGILWRSVRIADAGAWTRFGSTTLQVTMTPTVVDDTIKYTDVQGLLGWTGGPVEFTATAGARNGDHLPTLGGTATSWGSASAAVWIAPHVAIVASGGSYPVDLRQGFPGGRFAALGIRIGSRASSPPPAESSPVTERAAPEGAIAAFTISSGSGGRKVLRARSASAKSVEVSGDFSEWKPVALARGGDGWWSAEVEIAPGTHQLNLRVDGAAWVVPPGLMSMRDEFGGVVGLVVIEK